MWTVLETRDPFRPGVNIQRVRRSNLAELNARFEWVKCVLNEGAGLRTYLEVAWDTCIGMYSD